MTLSRSKGRLPETTLGDMCRERGADLIEVFPGAVQHRAGSRTLPEQVASLIVDGRRVAGKRAGSWEVQRYARMLAGEYYRVPSVARACVGRTSVSARTGVHVTGAGGVIRDSIPTYNAAFHPGAPPPPGAATHFGGSVLSLLTLWDRNYAHWLMDSLPRLCAVDDPAVRIAVRAGSPRFVMESLELLGVGRDRVIEVGDEWFTADEVVCVRSAPTSGVPHGGLLRCLRKRLIEAVGPAAGGEGKRVFVQRGDTASSSKRRILNEAEVLDALRGHGIEAVRPEALPFREQVALFASAELVCGAHGAGIYNLLFARGGTPIIEFYNHAYWDHASVRLGGLLGLPHFHLFSPNADRERNFRVDVRQLARLLAMTLPGFEDVLCEERF